jgi:hypothetical protein
LDSFVIELDCQLSQVIDLTLPRFRVIDEGKIEDFAENAEQIII